MTNLMIFTIALINIQVAFVIPRVMYLILKYSTLKTDKRIPLMKRHIKYRHSVRNVVRVRSSSKRKTLVTMINSVAMVTNITIVNIGKLVILATKANMQQEKVV